MGPSVRGVAKREQPDKGKKNEETFYTLANFESRERGEIAKRNGEGQ